MFWMNVGIFLCIGIGIAGLVVSATDTNRFNFGHYLSLICVVGLIGGVASYVIKPELFQKPRWIERLSNRVAVLRRPTRNVRLPDHIRECEESTPCLTTETTLQKHSSMTGIGNNVL